MMNRFLIIPLILLLSGCGGSSSDKKAETTQPSPGAFSIEVSHLSNATENQPIDITITPSESHNISSSELSIDADIPIDITKKSNTEYTLIVPVIYKEQSLTLAISATNTQGETLASNSEVTISFNKPPKATLLTTSPIAKHGTSLIEFSIEDTHQLERLTLSSEQQGVIFTKLTDTNFEVTLNDTFIDDRLAITAEAIDEFQAKRTQNHYLDFGAPYLHFRGSNYAFLNERHYVNVYVLNESGSQEITNIQWTQLSGPTLTLERTASTNLAFVTPSEYSNEVIQLQATVTIDETIVLQKVHQITLVEDKPYTISTLDKELVDSKLLQLKAKDTDLNEDGLADIITIENAIAYVQLQNTDGSYSEKQQIGEVTFHQWFRSGPVPEIHLPTAENLRITDKNISLLDADNDGIKDIVFTGRIIYPLAAIHETIGGWLKGSGNLQFYGDFISEGIAADNFFDINKDGYLDWLYYTDYDSNAYAYINMSFATWPSTKNVQIDAKLINSSTLQTYDDSFGYTSDNGNFTFLRLYSTRKAWEYEEGAPENYERITVTEYQPNIGFQISYGILLNERARLIYFVDVTNDGIKDIVISDWDNNYYLVDVE